ncbi:MAG: 16S rRNA (guanine(1405)-N(7))-methyltransferase RmtF [Clostridia bacterium]|nr:16S rRNA (guanine(1405)-N(7))-methyltransferase RmtF [Clostridia bacterium]
MTEAEALNKLKASRNFRDICPSTVERALVSALNKYGKPEKALDAAKERLHALTNAFMSEGEAEKAVKCLENYIAGDVSAPYEALKCHASTRERLDELDGIYDKVFALAGTEGGLLDLACGLNPIYLGFRGISGVRGIDISGRACATVNAWAGACDWDVSAQPDDVNTCAFENGCRLALCMKLLSVIETDEKGAAERLLDRIPAEYIFVTFPTRSLSGRDVGMEKNYSNWFESLVSGKFDILDRFIMARELCYTISRKK